MRVRWGVLVLAAVLAGGWTGRVVGTPSTPVAQTTGSSSSAGGDSGSSGSGDSGSSGSGDSGSSGSGSSGSGSSGSGSGSGGQPGGGGGATTAPPGPGSTAPGGGPRSTTSTSRPVAPTSSIPEDRVADGERTSCGDAGEDGVACYEVTDAGGTEGVRIPDGHGGTVVVPILAVPVVNVDTGASTSASSNVDLRVDIDVDTGDVIRVERRVDPLRQLALLTLAVLLGLFIGAAVLGTYLRFRRGPAR